MTTEAGEKFPYGSPVVVARRDPEVHNRVPVYIRGARGVVRELLGRWELAELAVQGITAPPVPCYSVEFDAVELFGSGTHCVRVDVWESWLSESE